MSAISGLRTARDVAGEVEGGAGPGLCDQAASQSEAADCVASMILALSAS
jgi:hypothetical protein